MADLSCFASLAFQLNQRRHSKRGMISCRGSDTRLRSPPTAFVKREEEGRQVG